MKLSRQDANLFYELMWAIQFYVNQKLKIFTKIKTVDEYESSTSE